MCPAERRAVASQFLSSQRDLCPPLGRTPLHVAAAAHRHRPTAVQGPPCGGTAHTRVWAGPGDSLQASGVPSPQQLGSRTVFSPSVFTTGAVAGRPELLQGLNSDHSRGRDWAQISLLRLLQRTPQHWLLPRSLAGDSEVQAPRGRRAISGHEGEGAPGPGPSGLVPGAAGVVTGGDWPREGTWGRISSPCLSDTLAEKLLHFWACVRVSGSPETRCVCAREAHGVSGLGQRDRGLSQASPERS